MTFPEAWFQFLIGTVKTELVAEFVVIENKFQFLIGTVKTMILSYVFIKYV